MTMDNVEFISYDGKYPTLCSGMLVIKVLGKLYALCSWSEYMNKQYQRNRLCILNNPNITKIYDVLFLSGGSTDWTAENESERITYGDWEVKDLPANLLPFQKQITELFNDNVEKGCCGGCL